MGANFKFHPGYKTNSWGCKPTVTLDLEGRVVLPSCRFTMMPKPNEEVSKRTAWRMGRPVSWFLTGFWLNCRISKSSLLLSEQNVVREFLPWTTVMNTINQELITYQALNIHYLWPIKEPVREELWSLLKRWGIWCFEKLSTLDDQLISGEVAILS